MSNALNMGLNEQRLQAVETEVENLKALNDQIREDRRTRDQVVDERLRDLERTVYKAVGFMGAILAALEIVLKFAKP